ncbi:MAG: 50S ribosomal protein L23 [Candidatus Shapirobacteria bacterium]
MRGDVIIKKPVITEKTMKLASTGWFTFEVDLRANKNQIREVVAEAFKVKVMEVKTARQKGKEKRRRSGGTSRKPDRKKAIVKLAPGQKIDLFAVENKDEKHKKKNKES